MEPIKPIPPETIRAAARYMEREAAKMQRIVAQAEASGFPQMIRRTLALLARL